MPRSKPDANGQVTLPNLAALRPRSSTLSGFKRASTESDEQKALFKFLRLWQKRYPALSWVFSIPNGFFAGYDDAAKARAERMVEEGLTAGVWDIFVPVPRLAPDGRGYSHGLWIEMKTVTGELSSEQKDFIGEMARRGYSRVVARSWYEAARAILNHVGGCAAAERCLESGGI